MLTITFASVGLAAPTEFAFVAVNVSNSRNFETSSGVMNTRV